MSRSDDDLEKDGPPRFEPEEPLSDLYSYVDEEEFEEPTERSIFGQWWFRGLLAGVASLVVAVIALPYLLERQSPAPTRSVAVIENRSQSEPVSAEPASARAEREPPPALPALTSSGATKSSNMPTLLQAAKPEPPQVLSPPATPKTLATPPPTPTTTKVRRASAEVPSKAPASPAATKASPTRKKPGGLTGSKGTYWVQIGAFKNSKYASRLAARITDEQYPVEVSRRASGATPLAVRVGAYRDRQEAEAARVDLERKGFPGFVLKGQRR